jgi:hypothetical protein
MQTLLKKVKFYLQLVDGIWSVPLAFFMFWLVGLFLTYVFGYTTGTYDPGFIQPLFLASAVVIGATNVAVFGMYFTFRGLYRYLYGQKDETGKYINYSKIDWLKLKAQHRYFVAFFVFLFFVILIILVYLQFV